MLPNYMPAHRLDAGESGCMGVAVPYALGAAVARPGTPVLSMNGDFAFGWNGMRLRLPSATSCRSCSSSPTMVRSGAPKQPPDEEHVAGRALRQGVDG